MNLLHCKSEGCISDEDWRSVMNQREVTVSARCSKKRDAFAIQFVEMSPKEWHANRAVIVRPSDLRKGSGKASEASLSKIQGTFLIGENYGGCPYCQAMSYCLCFTCNGLSCWDGQTRQISCGWCKAKLNIKGNIEGLSGEEAARDGGRPTHRRGDASNSVQSSSNRISRRSSSNSIQRLP